MHPNPEPQQGNLKNVTARFPEIAKSLRGCPFESIILDAEVVAVDGATGLHGYTDIHALGEVVSWISASCQENQLKTEDSDDR